MGIHEKGWGDVVSTEHTLSFLTYLTLKVVQSSYLGVKYTVKFGGLYITIYRGTQWFIHHYVQGYTVVYTSQCTGVHSGLYIT